MANPDSSIELPKTSVVCKPSEGAFEQVFKMANINPKKTLFFDDSIRNIQTGKRVGLHTVWVSKRSRDSISVKQNLSFSKLTFLKILLYH
jgi:putative hydrolase of the HAD superfamily